MRLPLLALWSWVVLNLKLFWWSFCWLHTTERKCERKERSWERRLVRRRMAGGGRGGQGEKYPPRGSTWMTFCSITDNQNLTLWPREHELGVVTLSVLTESAVWQRFLRVEKHRIWESKGSLGHPSPFLDYKAMAHQFKKTIPIKSSYIYLCINWL